MRKADNLTTKPSATAKGAGRHQRRDALSEVEGVSRDRDG